MIVRTMHLFLLLLIWIPNLTIFVTTTSNFQSSFFQRRIPPSGTKYGSHDAVPDAIMSQDQRPVFTQRVSNYSRNYNYYNNNESRSLATSPFFKNVPLFVSYFLQLFKHPQPTRPTLSNIKQYSRPVSFTRTPKQMVSSLPFMVPKDNETEDQKMIFMEKTANIKGQIYTLPPFMMETMNQNKKSTDQLLDTQATMPVTNTSLIRTTRQNLMGLDRSALKDSSLDDFESLYSDLPPLPQVSDDDDEEDILHKQVISNNQVSSTTSSTAEKVTTTTTTAPSTTTPRTTTTTRAPTTTTVPSTSGIDIHSSSSEELKDLPTSDDDYSAQNEAINFTPLPVIFPVDTSSTIVTRVTAKIASTTTTTTQKPVIPGEFGELPLPISEEEDSSSDEGEELPDFIRDILSTTSSTVKTTNFIINPPPTTSTTSDPTKKKLRLDDYGDLAPVPVFEEDYSESNLPAVPSSTTTTTEAPVQTTTKRTTTTTTTTSTTTTTEPTQEPDFSEIEYSSTSPPIRRSRPRPRPVPRPVKTENTQKNNNNNSLAKELENIRNSLQTLFASLANPTSNSNSDASSMASMAAAVNHYINIQIGTINLNSGDNSHVIYNSPDPNHNPKRNTLDGHGLPTAFAKNYHDSASSETVPSTQVKLSVPGDQKSKDNSPTINSYRGEPSRPISPIRSSPDITPTLVITESSENEKPIISSNPPVGKSFDKTSEDGPPVPLAPLDDYDLPDFPPSPALAVSGNFEGFNSNTFLRSRSSATTPLDSANPKHQKELSHNSGEKPPLPIVSEDDVIPVDLPIEVRLTGPKKGQRQRTGRRKDENHR